MSRLSLIVALLVPLIQFSAAMAQEKTPQKRRVYVLHSGMHIILAFDEKNHAAVTLRKSLLARGVPERDLILMESPFPMATLKDMVPREGLILYLESTDPASRSAHAAYERLHDALKARGITKDDNVAWLGHSAGGQIGMTMAYLAQNLAKYPELAKKTQSYRIDTVITLGSAVGSNHTPAAVQLRHYYSSGDTMQFFLSKHGNFVSSAMESKVRFRPCCEVGVNAMIRVFPKIDHGDWYVDDGVLVSILGEFAPRRPPAWRRIQAEAGTGTALSQLISRALESELRISLEEQRH